jgi:uncharacterized coiled-coil protein SlyX
MTMIELDQELESLRCGFVFDAEPVRDLYRAALARVAELESQLAAQGWRPVTETMTMTEQRLTSDELRQVLAEWIRPMYTRERRKLAGLFEAVIARAEAAEAEAEDAILVASDAAQREESAMHALSHFRARVAELESQLAAQGWRPVTEKPPEPPDGETSEYLTWNDFTGFTVRRYLDGQFRSVFRNPPTHWRPLPPAPQEPTR